MNGTQSISFCTQNYLKRSSQGQLLKHKVLQAMKCEVTHDKHMYEGKGYFRLLQR